MKLPPKPTISPCRISLAVGGAIVQEWSGAGDEQIMFCLQYVGADGPVASFVGRKLRSWPPMFGGTASCTVAPEEVRDRLSRMTSRFFAVTGFQGMGSMEFKIDPRDDTPYLIEPTVGRTDFQEEVATVNGVNVPLAAFCHEASRPAPRCAYLPKAIVWIDNSGDTTVSRSRRLRDALDVHQCPVALDETPARACKAYSIAAGVRAPSIDEAWYVTSPAMLPLGGAQTSGERRSLHGRGRVQCKGASAYLEREFASILGGVCTAFALNSGRAAITLALQVFRQLVPGRSTVLVPAYVCPAVLRCGPMPA